MNWPTATISIEGYEIPDPLEPRCRTCTHEARDEIEKLVLTGLGYTEIARRFPDSGLTARNIKDHVVADHFPIRAATKVVLREERAVERGAMIEPAARAAAGHVEFAKLVLGRVQEGVENGDIKPGLRDGLKAAEILARLGADSTFASPEYHELIGAAFSRIVEIVKDESNTEAWQRIVERIKDDPALADLESRYNDEASRHQ